MLQEQSEARVMWLNLHTSPPKRTLLRKVLFQDVFIFILCVERSWLTCLCTTFMQFLQRPEGAPDSMDLQLQMAVNHPVGAENQPGVLCKSSRCSQLLSHLASFVFRILTKEEKSSLNAGRTIPRAVVSE